MHLKQTIQPGCYLSGILYSQNEREGAEAKFENFKIKKVSFDFVETILFLALHVRTKSVNFIFTLCK